MIRLRKVQNLWLIYLLLGALLGNTVHFLSHFRHHLEDNATLTINADTGGETNRNSLTSDNDCLACQSFQHSVSEAQTLILITEPPQTIITIAENAPLIHHFLQVNSQGVRGPPHC